MGGRGGLIRDLRCAHTSISQCILVKLYTYIYIYIYLYWYVDILRYVCTHVHMQPPPISRWGMHYTVFLLHTPEKRPTNLSNPTRGSPKLAPTSSQKLAGNRTKCMRTCASQVVSSLKRSICKAQQEQLWISILCLGNTVNCT